MCHTFIVCKNKNNVFYLLELIIFYFYEEEMLLYQYLNNNWKLTLRNVAEADPQAKWQLGHTSKCGGGVKDWANNGWDTTHTPADGMTGKSIPLKPYPGYISAFQFDLATNYAAILYLGWSNDITF